MIQCKPTVNWPQINTDAHGWSYSLVVLWQSICVDLCLPVAALIPSHGKVWNR